MTGWDSSFGASDLFTGVGGRTEQIEIVGPHLRVSGTMSLGRFTRLTDLVNHSRGYVQLHDARLLRRNGDPTSLTIATLMVNQDEITFIGQGGQGPQGEGNEAIAGDLLTGDRPLIEKTPRRFVVFTPGHAITGFIHVHREMTIENFVEASDSRFVPMTVVTARSLADRRVISHFHLLLVNRTQMTAVAEMDPGSAVIQAVAEVEVEGDGV